MGGDIPLLTHTPWGLKKWKFFYNIVAEDLVFGAVIPFRVVGNPLCFEGQ